MDSAQMPQLPSQCKRKGSMFLSSKVTPFIVPQIYKSPPRVEETWFYYAHAFRVRSALACIILPPKWSHHPQQIRFYATRWILPSALCTPSLQRLGCLAALLLQYSPWHVMRSTLLARPGMLSLCCPYPSSKVLMVAPSIACKERTLASRSFLSWWPALHVLSVRGPHPRS